MAVQTVTEDLCRDILADLENNFLQSIHPSSIIPTLFAKGLVSSVQRDEIQTAAKSVSRFQACSLLTEALRQLPKGTDTPKIFYRVLHGARGHKSIAEKMRKAFRDHGIDITEEPVASLPLSQQTSTRQDDDTPSTSAILTKPVIASEQGKYPHLPKPSRPFHEVLVRPVRPDVPTPPEHLFVPTDVVKINREFSRLLGSTFEVVSTLPRLKLRFLRKLLGGLLRENCFGKAKELPTDAEEIAELVTSEDQDFVNYVVLHEAIGMVNNEELSKMLIEYEENLELHKERCICESVQQTKKLEEVGDVVIVHMGHKDKSNEEFKFSHVVAERSFLVDVTEIARVTFKGFTSHSGTSLYFSIPEDSVYLLVPALRDNLKMLQQWGVTDVTVYNYFTFSLIDEDSFVSWRPEMDKKLKGEKDQMSAAADHVKMTNRIRNKSGGDKGRHGVSSVDVLLLKNQSLRRRFQDMGLTAEVLGSGQSDPTVFGKVCKGHYQIVLLSPEYLLENEAFRDALQDPSLHEYICAIVVDEAHCICTWGEGFRPLYARLGEIRSLLKPGINILAMTATAEKRTRDYIKSTLQLRPPIYIELSPDRPEIFYGISKSTTLSNLAECLVQGLLKYGTKYPKTLVFL